MKTDRDIVMDYYWLEFLYAADFKMVPDQINFWIWFRNHSIRDRKKAQSNWDKAINQYKSGDVPKKCEGSK